VLIINTLLLNFINHSSTPTSRRLNVVAWSPPLYQRGGPKWRQGRRHGVDWGNSLPTPLKGHFCKSFKTDEKILWVWRVTSPTILEFQPEFVTSGFQRPDLTYILLCDAIRFILHKTGAHKQGRRQKNFQGGPTEKRLKNSKKDRKIALLSLYLLYLYRVRKSRGEHDPPCPSLPTPMLIKFVRLLILSYSPVFKCIYLDSEMTVKIQQFQLSKNK